MIKKLNFKKGDHLVRHEIFGDEIEIEWDIEIGQMSREKQLQLSGFEIRLDLSSSSRKRSTNEDTKSETVIARVIKMKSKLLYWNSIYDILPLRPQKQGELRKCSILIAVTLLLHVALVSLVRHHTTPSLLF